ncbi:MAG: hypothetical protein Q7K45_00170 [Nanoarchaeota archaeon]|nr:hypothetical protein [Nanoarchaeota archaeon]
MAKAKAKAAVSSSSGRSALLGSWSFLIGLILAVIMGLGYGGVYADTLVWVIFLLGVVVGLLNITHDEANAFLMSGTVLVLVSYAGASAIADVSLVSYSMSNLLRGILTMFVPATMIVALKSVFQLARR